MNMEGIDDWDNGLIEFRLMESTCMLPSSKLEVTALKLNTDSRLKMSH